MSMVDEALASVPRAPFLDGPPPRDDEAAPPIGGGQRGTPHDVLRRMLQAEHADNILAGMGIGGRGQETGIAEQF